MNRSTVYEAASAFMPAQAGTKVGWVALSVKTRTYGPSVLKTSEPCCTTLPPTHRAPPVPLSESGLPETHFESKGAAAAKSVQPQSWDDSASARSVPNRHDRLPPPLSEKTPARQKTEQH